MYSIDDEDGELAYPDFGEDEVPAQCQKCNDHFIARKVMGNFQYILEF